MGLGVGALHELVQRGLDHLRRALLANNDHAPVHRDAGVRHGVLEGLARGPLVFPRLLALAGHDLTLRSRPLLA